jgi:hypothetical protein
LIKNFGRFKKEINSSTYNKLRGEIKTIGIKSLAPPTQ